MSETNMKRASMAQRHAAGRHSDYPRNGCSACAKRTPGPTAHQEQPEPAERERLTDEIAAVLLWSPLIRGDAPVGDLAELARSIAAIRAREATPLDRECVLEQCAQIALSQFRFGGTPAEICNTIAANIRALAGEAAPTPERELDGAPGETLSQTQARVRREMGLTPPEAK